MSENNHSQILSEYAARAPQYADLASVAKTLIEQLLAHRQIPVHSVTCRPKDTESLSRKLLKPQRDYTNLLDITDLAGVRVTTYFEPDVEKVSRMIEEEFQVDRRSSSDKRSALDPDRFGYLSVHYVVTLSVQRAELAEYARFAEMKFEIQVRSILQHAWAEIEHDLGYKTKASVPQEIRRRFSRIAGLLELADAEFAAIRAELAQYEELVPERIEREPERVAIDLASLTAFITSNEMLKRADAELARKVGSVTVVDVVPPVLEQLIPRLKDVGLNTIGEIEAAFEPRASMLAPYAKSFIVTDSPTIFSGWTLMILPYLIVAESGSISRVRDFVQRFNAGNDEFVEKILSSYNTMFKT